MPLFQWANEFSVGVDSMDRHHQRLFDLINKLHDAMKEGKGSTVVSSIITELFDYTKYHFGEEEKLMERINYIGIAEQKAAHKHFVSTIEEYKAKADKGLAAFIGGGISLMLVDWLKNHIGMMDKKYTEAMRAKGIK